LKFIGKGMLFAALALGAAGAQGAARNEPPRLKGATTGEAAIARHGDRLDRVASRARTTRAKLERELRGNRDAWLDETGNLFIHDQGLVPLEDTDPVINPDAAQIPDSQTFQLHSRPGARRTIQLEFRGGTVRGTYWSSTDIVAAPFDVDGNPYAFSADEMARIRTIWAAVSEDYAAFDVDVTTEAVDESKLLRSSSSDLDYGTRVMITPSWEWYGQAGGVAYVGSFEWTGTVVTPAWVFSTLLSNVPKYVAEAVSHEAGHTLGLYHWAQYDSSGAMTTGYYAGNGVWAPIMGVGYYVTTTTWSKGEYPGAGTSSGAGALQDDVATISRNAPKRADESTTAVGGVAGGSGFDIRQVGIIGSAGDSDTWEIPAGAGALTVAIAPARMEANADFSAVLRDPAGAIVGSGDPAGVGPISISVPYATEGTYTLQVTGVGYGSYYSSYGSLGRYYVTGSSAAGPGPQPSPTPSPTPTPSPSPTVTSTPPPTSGDSTPPAVAVTSPANGATVARKALVTLAANASDDGAVSRVEFRVAGSLVCTDSSAPYSCGWSVPNAPRKSYSIEARAYDASGNSAAASVTVRSN
jgi:hypothetical protein